MELAAGLEIINSVLLVFLLYIYVQNYRQMKTVFGLGLIFFAVLLLVQNVLAAYFHMAMLDFYSREAMEHGMILSGVQTVALGVLAFVTWKD